MKKSFYIFCTEIFRVLLKIAEHFSLRLGKLFYKDFGFFVFRKKGKIKQTAV